MRTLFFWVLLVVSGTAVAAEEKNFVIGGAGALTAGASGALEYKLRKDHRAVWLKSLPNQMKEADRSQASLDEGKKKASDARSRASDLEDSFVKARDGYSTYHTERQWAYGPTHSTDANGNRSTSYGYEWRDVQVETRHAPDPAAASRLKPQWIAADCEAARLEEAAAKLKGIDKAADDALLVAKKSAMESDAALKSAVKSVIAKRILNGSIGVVGLGSVGYAAYSAITSTRDAKYGSAYGTSLRQDSDWSRDAR